MIVLMTPALSGLIGQTQVLALQPIPSPRQRQSAQTAGLLRHVVQVLPKQALATAVCPLPESAAEFVFVVTL